MAKPTITGVKTYWNKNIVCGGQALPNKWITELLNSINLKGKKVLDIGCGFGRFVYYLREKGIDAIGIDISESSIKLAKDNNCAVGNAEDLQFENNSFDVVISLGVLHHTPDINKAIQEIWRVLKPDGIVFVVLYNKYDPLFIIIKALRRINFCGWIKAKNPELFECPILNTYSKKEIKKLFKAFKNLKFGTSGSSFRIFKTYIMLEANKGGGK